MSQRLAVYHPPGRLGLKGNPFGKDVANLELYRALALHGGFDDLAVLSQRPGTDAELADDLLEGRPCQTRLSVGSILDQALAARAGALLRGQPDLHELAWLRRRTVGDRGYSLLGLAHTLAPPLMRQTIAMASVAPTFSWDAIICTSPSVRDGLADMFAAWGDHLAERTGGRAPPGPSLPVVPLGVDGTRFAALADRPEIRRRRREVLGLGEDDVLILWVGRLSFFEKAFPQPMFRAVQTAARASGKKIAFGLAGWFPGQRDPDLYRQAAEAYAPDVNVHFLDGNDAELVGELWAAADIFLSLVDNIQETFGITPLEAMAAGLPVVVSDWDGYRSTVRDGAEGFLIPTLLPNAGGLGDTLVLRQAMEIDPYQIYVGSTAQFTAVHEGRAAEALTRLIGDPDLRLQMGRAGRARVAAAFDWPIVARAYAQLADELAAVRAASAEAPARHRMNPAKTDPFQAFAGFASRRIDMDLRLTVAAGMTVTDLQRTQAIELDQVFTGLRASLEECAQALAMIAACDGISVRDVLLAFPTPRRRAVELGLAWMAKHGFVDWLT